MLAHLQGHVPSGWDLGLDRLGEPLDLDSVGVAGAPKSVIADGPGDAAVLGRDRVPTRTASARTIRSARPGGTPVPVATSSR